MSFYTYILLLLLFLKTENRLVFVMTLFRHGARAPTHLYNKTKYDYILNEWDNPGELTGIGQRMHFLLGWRNRIKYINEEKFLSEKFDPHEILIYSTCINRTILSAASQLQD